MRNFKMCLVVLRLMHLDWIDKRTHTFQHFVELIIWAVITTLLIIWDIILLTKNLLKYGSMHKPSAPSGSEGK